MLRARSSILTLLALLAGASPSPAAQSRALVVTTDFISGAFGWLDLDTRTAHNDVSTVHSDATLRWYEGMVYVINRAGADNIQVLDPAADFHTAYQFSVGNGTNPQDIAIASPTKAYVSRYDSPSLLVCNPTTGATIGTISLASFADADGLPEMAHLALVGHRLFVAVQRLDRNAGYSPTAYSLVVAIDTDADTVIDANPALPGIQGITLTYKDPVTTFQYDRNTGRLLIGSCGFFGANDGGIEAIDVNTLSDLGSVVGEDALGGDLGDFELLNATHAYAIVSDASFNSSLVSWNPATHLKLATIASPGGFSLSDCALDDRGELYLANNGFSAPGLYVYRAGVDTLITGPIGTGLPPNQIAFDEARSEVAGVVPSASALAFSSPWPNPARSEVRFTLSLTERSSVCVEAFDLAGRRVSTLAEGPRGAGVSSVSWNLADQAGRHVNPGVYLVRARIGAATVTRRVVVVR